MHGGASRPPPMEEHLDFRPSPGAHGSCAPLGGSSPPPDGQGDGASLPGRSGDEPDIECGREGCQMTKSKLKPLHWRKVSRALQGSLWEELQRQGPPELDVAELETLFSNRTPNTSTGCLAAVLTIDDKLVDVQGREVSIGDQYVGENEGSIKPFVH
ncbi:hypothetical protein QVD17_38944 [Tagetes erecta]|uniref:Uncharacterized protein n=1 Tax=Tagetes erecta TaxID=13708 RepID=A0AAD8JMN8_TARER|nr:hypothetical protein QVD17_38944 [Tagetes erecta]